VNIVLTLSIAVIQARAAIINRKANSLIDLSDMQAFQAFKRNLDTYIAAKTAALEVPNNPLGYVRTELKAAINAMGKSDQFYAECMAYSLPESGKILKTMSDLSREKAEYSQRLSEIAAKFPTDVFEQDDTIAPLVEEVRKFVNLPVPDGRSIRELRLFANGKGKLYAQVQRCWGAYISEYNGQIDNLIAITKYASDGDHITARKKYDQITRRFADLDYKSVEQTISTAELKAEHETETRLLAEAAGHAQTGDHLAARRVFNQLSRKFTDLDYKSIEQAISAAELKAEHKTEAGLLAEAAEHAQARDHLAARRVFNQLSRKFTDLDYEFVNQQIERWENRLDEVDEYAAGVKVCMQDPVTSVWWRPLKYYIDGSCASKLRRAKLAKLKEMIEALKDDASFYSDNEYLQEAERLLNLIDPLISRWESTVHSIERASTVRLICTAVVFLILLLASCVLWLLPIVLAG
jgi:hypothetical protein